MDSAERPKKAAHRGIGSWTHENLPFVGFGNVRNSWLAESYVAVTALDIFLRGVSK
jgi:hypothetical protein